MMKAIKDRNPSLAYEQIAKLNDILAFADDTLIFGQNLFDIRRAIGGISNEIKRMGLEINPSKCTLLAKHLDPNEIKEQSPTAVSY